MADSALYQQPSAKERLLKALKPVVSRVPGVAAAFRYIRDNKKSFETPRATPNGFMFCGNGLVNTGKYEPEETAVVNRILPHVDTVVNIGANVGYYCCLALQAGKRVIAFEPVRPSFSCICKNIVANGWEDAVELYPMAITDRPGIIPFYGANPGASLIEGWADQPADYVEWVPASSLNTVIGDRLTGKRTLIITDIEGAEHRMLQGAGKILDNDPKPIWMVEIQSTECQPSGVPFNPHFAETFALFFERGYAALATRDLTPVTPAAVRESVDTQTNATGGLNFVFCEPELVDAMFADD